MAIILEGMDNTGKTTLAGVFSRPILHPGPKPKNLHDELVCLKQQLADGINDVVMDRVTCISAKVYGSRCPDTMLSSYMRAMLSTPRTVLVYCRPPDGVVLDFRHHNVKPYDTPETLQLLADNASQYLRSYDWVSKSVPHLLYNYTIANDVVEQAKRISSDDGAWREFMNAWLNSHPNERDKWTPYML